MCANFVRRRYSCPSNTAVVSPLSPSTYLFLPSPPSRAGGHVTMRTAKRPRAEEDEQSSKRLRPGSLGAAENAPRTSGGATRARNAVDPIAKLASARSEVKALEPFINASLEEMLQHKLQDGIKKYVTFATKKKHCEADALTISEDWLGGTPLLRIVKFPATRARGASASPCVPTTVGSQTAARRLSGRRRSRCRGKGSPRTSPCAS